MGVSMFFSAKEACDYLGIEMPEAWAQVEALYPVVLNSYYLDLIDRKNLWNDPIFLQCMPQVAELEDMDSATDPLAEEEQSAVPRLIHRYRDRVVLLSTGHCYMRCRFCFRKRAWTRGQELGVISDQELDAAVAYLQKHPEIHEVLISGGDPLTLPHQVLLRILETLSALTSITVIRIGSRTPVTLPEILSDEWIEDIAAFEKVWLLTHFNHPREVTAESERVCRAFVRRGVPVLNQTVLMRRINDKPEILEELSRRLLAIKVKPHYLFHVDPVRGVRHYATGIEAGLETLRYFRSRLSSLGVPTFAIDLPEGGGKVALQPEYGKGMCFPSIQNPEHLIDYPDGRLGKNTEK